MKYAIRYQQTYNKDTQSVSVKTLDYRSKWACVCCRKAFTRVRENIDSKVKCPDCGKLAIDMGHLFEPPAKRNIRLWKIMQMLGENGIKYSRSGMVAKINYLITGDNKLSLKVVNENINRFLGKPK